MRNRNSQAPIWLIVAGLVLLTLVTYWPVRQHDFVQYDDQDYVTSNAMVQRGLTLDGLRWAFTQSHAANWHPLTWLSHMLDCELFGLWAGGHHLVNVFIHAINSVLVFLLLRSLTSAIWRSAFVAGLFALHPLHVESVAWVAERKDVLSTCFGLLSLQAYRVYAKADGGMIGRKLAYYALALMLFAFGLMSKPMLVTLPCLMLLLDWWPLQRLSRGKLQRPQLGSLLLEKVPFFALSSLSCFITLNVQQPGMMFYSNLPVLSRIANAVVSIPRYLAKTFWPFDLAVLYPHPAAWPVWQIAASAVLVSGLIGLAFWQRRQRPWLAVGWFWFLGTLVPVLGLVQVGVQSMADRYTYLPVIGVFIAITWAGHECLTRWRLPAASQLASAAMIVIVCAVATRVQLRVWANTESLFTQTIRVTRNNWVAHYNLALLAMHRYQATHRADIANQAAQSPMPGSMPRDYLNEVIQHCEATVQIKPGFPDPRITLAKALTERGELASARQQLEIVLALTPDNAGARQNLAEILLRQNEIKPALAEYRRTLELKPDWPEVLNNVAWLLATSPDPQVRNTEEAVKLARRACNLSNQTNLWFLHTLAAAYAGNGDFTNATTTAGLALRRAEASGSAALINTARQRLNLYQSQTSRDATSNNSDKPVDP